MDYKELIEVAIALDPEQTIFHTSPLYSSPFLLKLSDSIPQERKNFNYDGASVTWVDEDLIQWCTYATAERIQVIKDEGYTRNLEMDVPFKDSEPIYPEDVATAWEASKPTI